MITFQNVNFTYAGVREPQLKNCSFAIKPGELVLLVGESGCGKSTIIKLINGILQYDKAGTLSGTVALEQRNIRDIPMWELAQHVGSVFQNPKSQFFNLDTTNEILFGLENCGASRAEMHKALDTVSKVCDVQELLGRNIFELSGGEKQRIACASAFAPDPEVFVMDEPSSNLDQKSIHKLRAIIRQMKQRGKTVLVAEHRLWYVADLADRIFFVRNGVLEQVFSSEEFCALPQATRKQMGLRSIHEVNLHPENRAVAQSSEGGLQVRGLCAAYGKKHVWKDVNFTVPDGTIMALTGANGSGKSTLARILCGLFKEKSGTITYHGRKLLRKERRKQCFLIMQDVNSQLFADSVLAEARLGNHATEETAEKVIQQLGLLEYKEQHPMSLSGGQKQRLAVCDGVLSEERILIFDEPTSGLDYTHMLQVSGILKRLASQGYCVMVITHDTELIEESGATVLSWQGKEALT